MAEPTPPDPDAEPGEGARPGADDDGSARRRLVARVLTWQHRHPLACRLTEADVSGEGVVALPYGAGPQGGPLFHQPNLLPGLSHRALVAFAARHAVAQRPGPADWPQRDIERADAAAEPAPQTRYLLTAALRDPRRASPSRLLLAPAAPALWGRRPLDKARLVAAGVLAALLLGLGTWTLVGGLKRRAQPAPAAVAVPASAPAPAASAASFPSPASAASALRVAAAASASAPGPGPAAASAPAPRPAASVPAATLPAASASARAGAAAPSAPGAAAAPPRPAPAPSPASQAPGPASAAPAASLPAPRVLPMPSRASVAQAVASAASAPPALPAGPHFALVSAPERQRAAADATLQRVRQLLGPAIGNLQAQVMPSPQGFVVTVWPLPTQADAERLAEVLARRGVPMKWMEF